MICLLKKLTMMLMMLNLLQLGELQQRTKEIMSCQIQMMTWRILMNQLPHLLKGDEDVAEVLEEEEEELLLLLQAEELHQLNEVEVEHLHHQGQLNLPLLNHLLKQEDKHKLILVQEQYHKETRNKCLSQIVMILIKKHA